MAVDTENKRRSVLHNLPAPDGTVDQPDRQQVTWNYSGILAEAPMAPEIPETIPNLDKYPGYSPNIYGTIPEDEYDPALDPEVVEIYYGQGFYADWAENDGPNYVDAVEQARQDLLNKTYRSYPKSGVTLRYGNVEDF